MNTALWRANPNEGGVTPNGFDLSYLNIEADKSRQVLTEEMMMDLIHATFSNRHIALNYSEYRHSSGHDWMTQLIIFDPKAVDDEDQRREYASTCMKFVNALVDIVVANPTKRLLLAALRVYWHQTHRLDILITYCLV